MGFLCSSTPSMRKQLGGVERQRTHQQGLDEPASRYGGDVATSVERAGLMGSGVLRESHNNSESVFRSVDRWGEGQR